MLSTFSTVSLDALRRGAWRSAAGRARLRCVRRVSGSPAGAARDVDLPALRAARADEVAALPEVYQRQRLRDAIRTGTCREAEIDEPKARGGIPPSTLEEAGLTREDMMLLLRAGFATSLLHAEARVASLLGEGFYTIGPAGEECLAAVALALRPTDPIALHYRHVATQLARQLASGKSMDAVLLDRARGFVVSALDGISGGGHCLIGGGKYDFLVTSTLASQAPPAVGRALGGSLANALEARGTLPEGTSTFPRDFVSYVSVGDGSVNNAHFLSATNFAEYVQHRSFRCPVVFAISDNDLAISLRGYDWVHRFVERYHMPLFEARSDNMLDVYAKTAQATEFARKTRRPAFLLFDDVPRRFGHAATDRQIAYLTNEEIKAAQDADPMEHSIAAAVKLGVATYDELADEYESIWKATEIAFDTAVREPKITTREEVVARNAQPLVAIGGIKTADTESEERRQVMRKQMTRVFDEQLAERPNLVYLGEDVEHGGYYIVTEGLVDKYPERVRDFPPDETSLVGAGMGYSQAGLLPIVEIPYAKYLDCGADMFFEACVMNWLSNGQAPVGMIFRLQGFDRGLFGGNFHTHNSLHLPPGLDVVAYSNGEDYVRGMRYALLQAAAGRIVMSVDSTSLLNQHHVDGRDNAWKRQYPTELDDMMPFDEVRVYKHVGRDASMADVVDQSVRVRDAEDAKKAFDSAPADSPAPRIAVVTYGTGVPLSLVVQSDMASDPAVDITVVDVPYLSDVAEGLVGALQHGKFDGIILADPCKEGGAPLATTAVRLQKYDLDIPTRVVAAPHTYNPLGSMVTFLSTEDITTAVTSLTQKM